MKKLIIAGLAIAMCLGVFATKSMAADKAAAFGARLGYVSCSDCDGSFQIAGDYFIPVMQKDDVDVRLSYSSESIVNIWSLSGNYIYNFPETAGAGWYAGAGLGFTRFSVDLGSGLTFDETDFGINVLGGYKFANKVSVEAIYTWISGGDINVDAFYGINVGYRF